MDFLQEYNRWLSWPGMDAETKDALCAMTREQTEDAFYRDLAFGTGGAAGGKGLCRVENLVPPAIVDEIGRASCRERV